MKFTGILNETGPTLNENAFHSFVVANQIFFWQLPQLHHAIGSYQSHDNELTIKTDFSLAEKQEKQAEMAPAHTAFTIWSLEECLEGHKSTWTASAESCTKDLDELEPSLEYWDT